MTRLEDLYKLLKRESDTLFDGSHNIHTPKAVVDDLLSKLEFDSKSILVMYNPEFVLGLALAGIDPEQITFFSDHVNKNKLMDKFNVRYVDTLEDSMKFDVVVGNPPYQDGTKEGGQNKIYNIICKNSLNLLKEDGVIAFITPTSVLKKSKRFSLIGQRGLKHVNFTADNFFNVGIKICSWIVDLKHTSSDVTVTNIDGSTSVQSKDSVIYDYSIVDKDFAKIYNTLKELTDTPAKRMFDENNFGDAIVKSPSTDHPYKIYSIAKDKTKQIFGYSKRQPFFYEKEKIIIPMTKTLTEDSILVDVDDYYVAYLCLEVKNKDQIENIKSFIMSDYFKEHSAKWKDLDGYGFNYALKYLPKFDVNKKWTSKEVKEFIESHVE